MSELAFNQNGDLFDVPAVVTGWRVRRLKPRGAPELVYGKDGRPLTIPIEAGTGSSSTTTTAGRRTTRTSKRSSRSVPTSIARSRSTCAQAT